MKTIRIGNDIQLNWYITRFGEPEDFSNKNLSIALIDKFNNKQDFDYTINGNVISGTFYGKNQRTNGVYRLLLIENKDENDMVSLDYIDCFCLSNKLKNQTSIGSDTTSTINTEIVEVSSEISTTPDLSKYAKIEYVDGKVLMLENEISANTEYIETLSGNVNNIESSLANKANLINGTVPTNELPLATITTNGSVKLYNANGINRSGLLLQQDGGLLVNTSQDKGLYRDGAGQLHANIKGAATDEEIEEGTATNKALTPANMEKIKSEVTDSIMSKVGPDSAGREYVDLGLPSGTLWATMNIGAERETNTGLYFQWGDTQGYTRSQIGEGEGKKYFSWTDYKFNPSGDGKTFTKYNATDGKTVLDLEDDAAQANWGGDWHIPTEEQYQELLDNTNNEWTKVNNVNGYKFTNKTDSSKYIFIPAVGSVENGRVNDEYNFGHVWSSSLNASIVTNSRSLYFYSSKIDVNTYGSYRFRGISVRGVLDSSTPSKLHKVAVTGDYNDLENKPTPTTIEGAATDAEIDDKTSANKALTPSNIDKLKTVFTSEIITELNQIKQRLASLEKNI